jgi:hypothetical protein
MTLSGFHPAVGEWLEIQTIPNWSNQKIEKVTKIEMVLEAAV